MTKPLAVFVDGDNLAAKHAESILSIARKHGMPSYVRVYLNAQVNSGWHDAPGYRLIHAGTGKNATDILLCIDAMECFLRHGIKTFVIASSDGDFIHLAQRLREYQAEVILVGESKAPQTVRANCAKFVALNPPLDPNSPLDLNGKIHAMIAVHSKQGKGMRITDLAREMHRQHGIRISTYPEKNWRGYLAARPALFALDPRGPEAMVRFRPEGFAKGT